MDELKKQILKDIDHFQYVTGRREVFLDAVEYNALSLAVIFDPHKQESRKERLGSIISNYSGKEKEIFDNITGNMVTLLSGTIDNWDDRLGEMYMELPGNKSIAGQYFTPYPISRMMAKMTLAGIDKDKEVITFNEPCCGSGGMCLAALEEFADQGINYANDVLVVANDIDRNCALMCYLQLSYAGAAAVVKQQNTLSQKTTDVFLTPAFALQYGKFKKIYESLNKKEAIM